MAGVANPKYSYGETTTIKRSVVDMIQLVSPKAVPVLKRLSPGMNNLSVECDQVTYEWVEDDLQLVSSLLATATITTNTTTCEITEHEGEFLLDGMILLIDSEQVIVTTKGDADDIVTIQRGWGGTTAATHAVGAVVEIVGRAADEGADAPDDSYTVPTIPYNYVQNFVAEVSLTDVEAQVKRYGVPRQWTYQEMKKLSETMKWVERQMFHGKKVLFATGGAAPGSFGGFEEFILAGNKNDLSSAPIERSDILDLMREIHALVSEEYMPTIAICGGFVMEKIIGMFEPYVRTDRSETMGGSLIQTVVTPYGNLDLLLSKTCPAAKLFLLNPSMIGLGPMGAESFHVMEMARTGTQEQRLLSGLYTMEMRNPKTHGMIYGISTTA